MPRPKGRKGERVKTFSNVTCTEVEKSIWVWQTLSLKWKYVTGRKKINLFMIEEHGELLPMFDCAGLAHAVEFSWGFTMGFACHKVAINREERRRLNKISDPVRREEALLAAV